MRILFWFSLLVSLCLLLNNSTAEHERKKRNTFNFSEIIRFIPKAKFIMQDLYDLWHIFLLDPQVSVEDALFPKKEHDMLGHLVMVSSKIADLEHEVGKTLESVGLILQAFPKILKLELNLHELTLIINQINFANDQMRQFLQTGYQNITGDFLNITTSKFELLAELHQNNSLEGSGSVMEETSNSIKRTVRFVEKYTLVNFAQWATGPSYYSLLSLIRRMNDLVLQGNQDGVFKLILDVSQEVQGNVCNLGQSPFQTLYNLYNTITIAELKGNVVLQFSYMLLKMYNKGDFTKEAQWAISTYEKYAKKKAEMIREVLFEADRSIYRCDPKQYVKGVTYTKLTKLLQGYIENEVNLNPYGTCRENCKYYQYTEYNGCFKNQFCANQTPCRGKVLDCRYVDSDMNICISSDSERRYDWVGYENGKTLGNKGVCEKKNLFQVDSWWRYLFWHCSYCLCLCDDINQRSDRYFNLREVTSDIEKNKIVTGARIVMQNQIIHVQIQQGVLTSLGIVNQSTLTWKPVDNYTVDDDYMYNNVDYHTMNWLERAIDIDDVSGPQEHVVTGLRFRKIGTHLNLEVRVTPINFTTGEVFSAAHSYWLGNDNTDISNKSPRTEIELSNPDIPIRNGPHSLNSRHNQFIQFQPTSFDTDAGQNTVPYLDSQALTSQGFPLSGIGLIHRGKKGSGGFIALKLISYDFTPYISSN